jgi:hypothetical protein
LSAALVGDLGGGVELIEGRGKDGLDLPVIFEEELAVAGLVDRPYGSSS